MAPRVLVALLLAVAILGCIPAQRSAAVQDDAFRLEIETASPRYESGSAVVVTARLTYVGPEPTVHAFGSGSGPVLFGLTQLDGPFDPGGSGTADCARYEFRRGEPQTVAYRKGGGWSADDPMADAYVAFFDDPRVRLPNGVFQFTARIELSIGDCRPPVAFHRLEAAIRVVMGGQVGPLEATPGA